VEAVAVGEPLGELTGEPLGELTGEPLGEPAGEPEAEPLAIGEVLPLGVALPPQLEIPMMISTIKPTTARPSLFCFLTVCIRITLTSWPGRSSRITAETYKNPIYVSALVNRGTIRQKGLEFYENVTFWVSYTGSGERMAKSLAVLASASWLGLVAPRTRPIRPSK
jgi:hypothetical protein